MDVYVQEIALQKIYVGQPLNPSFKLSCTKTTNYAIRMYDYGRERINHLLDVNARKVSCNFSPSDWLHTAF